MENPYEALIAITAILVLFGLPLGGLVIRFALQPLVKNLTEAIRGDSRGGLPPEEVDRIHARLDSLERRLEEEESISTRLLEIQELDRRIAKGSGGTGGSREGG